MDYALKIHAVPIAKSFEHSIPSPACRKFPWLLLTWLAQSSMTHPSLIFIKSQPMALTKPAFANNLPKAQAPFAENVPTPTSVKTSTGIFPIRKTFGFQLDSNSFPRSACGTPIAGRHQLFSLRLSHQNESQLVGLAVHACTPMPCQSLSQN